MARKRPRPLPLWVELAILFAVMAAMAVRW